jgi:AraC-like DNA-binding protein
MQPNFNIQRERDNQLHCYQYRNDKCLFQFHSPIEIYMVDEGEMEITVNGKRQTLRAGEVSVALSYDTHMYRTPQASRSSVFLIPPDMCEEFVRLTKGKRIVDPFIRDPSVYERLKHYHRAKSEGNAEPIRQKGYVYVVLGMLAECLKFEKNKAPRDTDLARRMLFFVGEKFRTDITPASVAQEFGYSQAYISRYFKACFGITLGAYLTVLRIKNALLMMREGKYEITRCAMESGFKSMRTFYRAFHEEFGCSPKEYMDNQKA